MGSSNATRRSPLALRGSLFGVAVAVTGLVYLDLCDWIFDCGCRAMWAGGASACNIQTAGHPDCPWCSYGFWGAAIPFLAIVGVQATVTLTPGRAGVGWRLLGALTALVVVGGLAGLAFGLASDYW